MDFDFASSSSVASSPGGGGGGGEDGGGSKVFGSFLVDKHSSTPYTDATQVIKHSFFRNCKYWETGVCHLIETRNQAADMTKTNFCCSVVKTIEETRPLLLSSQSSHN